MKIKTNRKPKPKKFRSQLSEAIHETAAGLHRAGLLDKETMREFDASCLTAVAVLSPKEIVALHRSERISQGVFARYLNVRPKLVSEWERGEKKPSGPSLKLLSIVKTKALDAITYQVWVRASGILDGPRTAHAGHLVRE
jgi:putative transcriptional regulator